MGKYRVDLGIGVVPAVVTCTNNQYSSEEKGKERRRKERARRGREGERGTGREEEGLPK